MIDNLSQTDVVSMGEINDQGLNCVFYIELYYKAIFNFATKTTNAHPLDSFNLGKTVRYIFISCSVMFSASLMLLWYRLHCRFTSESDETILERLSPCHSI
jgi:hypothetical protein